MLSVCNSTQTPPNQRERKEAQQRIDKKLLLVASPSGESGWLEGRAGGTLTSPLYLLESCGMGMYCLYKNKLTGRQQCPGKLWAADNVYILIWVVYAWVRADSHQAVCLHTFAIKNKEKITKY